MQDANYNVIGIVNETGRQLERYEYIPYGERTIYGRQTVLSDADEATNWSNDVRQRQDQQQAVDPVGLGLRAAQAPAVSFILVVAEEFFDGHPLTIEARELCRPGSETAHQEPALVAVFGQAMLSARRLPSDGGLGDSRTFQRAGDKLTQGFGLRQPKTRTGPKIRVIRGEKNALQRQQAEPSRTVFRFSTNSSEDTGFPRPRVHRRRRFGRFRDAAGRDTAAEADGPGHARPPR